jgi:hypothetical protein
VVARRRGPDIGGPPQQRAPLTRVLDSSTHCNAYKAGRWSGWLPKRLGSAPRWGRPTHLGACGLRAASSNAAAAAAVPRRTAAVRPGEGPGQTTGGLWLHRLLLPLLLLLLGLPRGCLLGGAHSCGCWRGLGTLYCQYRWAQCRALALQTLSGEPEGGEKSSGGMRRQAVWLDVVHPGVVRCDVVWCGVVRRGVVWCGLVLRGVVSCGAP